MTARRQSLSTTSSWLSRCIARGRRAGRELSRRRQSLAVPDRQRPLEFVRPRSLRARADRRPDCGRRLAATAGACRRAIRPAGNRGTRPASAGRWDPRGWKATIVRRLSVSTPNRLRRGAGRVARGSARRTRAGTRSSAARRCRGRVMVWRGARLRLIEASDPSLTDGFHLFEADNGFRWTAGDARLPSALFEGIDGASDLELHVGGSQRSAIR